MSNARIVCYGSDVYHKPGCKYVKRMKAKNRLEVTKENAIRHSCRICRCCNSMNHHINAEKNVIDFYKNHREMDYKLINGIFYVRTEMGCWKIVYLRSEERFTLFHFNKPSKLIDWNHLEAEGYHHQDDMPYAGTISKYLNYIYEHDNYKAAVKRGEHITEFSSKKSRTLAARSEKKRERKRIDYIFRCLEKNNSEFKKLSFC